jgi:hypothetical protein
MQKITLKFPSLQLMAECMFQLSITNPLIDYENYTLSADLSATQLEELKECKCEIIEQIVSE